MEAEAEAELSPDLFSRMGTFLSYQPAAFHWALIIIITTITFIQHTSLIGLFHIHYL